MVAEHISSSAGIPARTGWKPLISTAWLASLLFTGCSKQNPPATSAARQTNSAAALSPEVLSNLVADPGSAGRAATGRERPASVPANMPPSTNLAPAAAVPPPKAPAPPAPAEDIYQQAVAVMRTNATPAAAEEAVILFRSAAEKGNPAAQHALGVAYLTGLGIKKDVPAALQWLEKSATAKNPDALFKLASLYVRGDGVPVDEAKAAQFAREAAELGHTEAQYNLASLYAAGRAVPKDMKEAAKWYSKAALAGHATAQSNLGVLYATGEGVEKNPGEALKWWQKAAAQGQPSAQFNLARALEEGKIIPQDKLEAYKWYLLAADQDDTDAEAARDALAGELTPTDIANAFRLAREFRAKAFAKLQQP